MTQTIRVNYYAHLRDALKTSTEEVTLALPACEKQILECLAELHPRQRDIFMASRVAVNENCLDGKSRMDRQAGVDIISPISGG